MQKRVMNRRNFLGQGGTLGGALGLVSLTGCIGQANGATALSSNDSHQAASAVTSSGLAGVFSVQSYGATGNGSTDDTAAIQATINAAQATGGIVFFPPGSFKISSALIVSSRVKISGSGYQGDGGLGYLNKGVTQSTGFVGSVLVCGTSHHGIVVQTNEAVLIEGIQITYPSEPTSGMTGIYIEAAAGSGNSNTGSVLRDIYITGHSVGIQLVNCLDFVVDNCNLILGWTAGIVLSSPNYPSYGDSLITNCTIWGNGVPTYSCHIGVYSGGGLRVVNNKMNIGSGTNTSGILISPNLTVTQNVEPLIIANNSIEGCAVGICFNNANPLGMCSAVSIIGNEIWAGTNAILANTYGSGQWITGISIVGNTLMVNGGSGKTIMILDSVSLGVVTGNMFALSGGGTGAGIDLGAHSTNINVQSNVYASGLTPVSNSGSGNKLGQSST